MALTKIFVALLLVGIMSGTFAAPDQTAELEKSNENGDAQDVSVTIERLERPVELEEDDESGDLQRRTCYQKYTYCYHLFGRRCLRACFFQYRICRRFSRVQEAEGTLQDALVAPYQPAELEDENENGDVQRRIPFRLCYRIYYICRINYRFCAGACVYHYHLCKRGIVAQDAKDNIPQGFAAPDQIEAVERSDQPVELEEDDENINILSLVSID